VIAHRRAELGQMLVRQRLIAIELDRTFEAGERIARALARLERDAQLGERLGILRRQPDRPAEARQSFLAAAEHGQRGPAQAKGNRGSTVQCDGSVTAAQGVLGASEREQSARKIQQHRWPAGLQLQRGRHERRALRWLPELCQGCSEALHEVGIFRRSAQQFLQDCHGFAKAPGALMRDGGFEPFANDGGCHASLPYRTHPILRMR
jgi:hypothetical protein